MLKPLKQSEFSGILEWINKYRKIKINQNDLYNQLNYLLFINEYFSYSINEYGGYSFDLYWKTAPIILDNIQLGKFIVKFSLYCDNTFQVNARALTPNKSKVCTDYCHPHIDRDGFICLGDGESIIPEALNEYDFEIVVDSINKILNNYDDDAAFARISEWNGRICKNCLKSYELSNRCDNCDGNCCDNCHIRCKTCGIWMHHGCVKREDMCDHCLRAIYHVNTLKEQCNCIFCNPNQDINSAIQCSNIPF